MLDLVSTVESLNSTVMTAMTSRTTPSPLSEEPASADKIRILQTEIAKLTKTVHELKTLQEETKELEQIKQFETKDLDQINQFEAKDLEQINQFEAFQPDDSDDNMLDLSSFIDDSFFTTTTSTITTTTTTTTTDVPITTFNWFTSTPSTRRTTLASTRRKTTTAKSNTEFVPSSEGEGFLEITVSGSMGGKKPGYKFDSHKNLEIPRPCPCVTSFMNV